MEALHDGFAYDSSAYNGSAYDGSTIEALYKALCRSSCRASCGAFVRRASYRASCRASCRALCSLRRALYRVSIRRCNRLPTLCWDTRSPPGRLQDGVNATLYIDCRSILLADYCSHFSYLLPHYILLPPPSLYIYRGSRPTFIIKSFIHSTLCKSLHI